MQHILSQMKANNVLTAEELSAFNSAEAQDWAKWSDSKLAVLLFPNITRNFSESFQAFTYVKNVPEFSFVEQLSNQWIGSFFMWMAQGKIKKKYDIDDERSALYDVSLCGTMNLLYIFV